MSNKSNISDIINGSMYKFEKNTISLILFTDAAVFNSSGNKSIWAIFSCIAELPPALRNSYENIICHSYWSGSNPDFNKYLEDYNKEIDVLIKNGLQFGDTHLNIRVYVFIADAPARAKACNTMQFNGKYGCLHCMHPTTYEQKKTIYKNMLNIKLRTNQMYNLQWTRAIETSTNYEGIKGFSYLSTWIEIPSNVILDYMHLCFQGSYKFIFNYFFDSKNHLLPFYLGK